MRDEHLLHGPNVVLWGEGKERILPNQSERLLSSPYDLKRYIAVWACALMKPGRSTCLFSTTSFVGV